MVERSPEEAGVRCSIHRSSTNKMENLISRHCVSCEGGVLPLDQNKIQEYLKQVSGWQLVEGVSEKGVKYQLIRKEFKFSDFKKSINFVNKVADLAEQEKHHPNIDIRYNRIRFDLWTHAIYGLFDNDFILAAKIDKIFSENFQK